MLSYHAFNALLKTLEEPPENVIFILATTEPHKVLDTIISRCQRFDFRRITTDDIVKRLEYISAQENINISKEALYSIAKNSQGGMRDALALLDQISVLGVNKQINTNDINEILGKISYDSLYEITSCVIDADCSKSISLIDNIYSKGNEPVQIVTNLIRYFRDLMIIKNCSDKELIYSLTQINEMNYDKLKPQAEKFSVSEIIQIIDKPSYYASQIKETTDKYLWLELCIIDLTNYKNLPSVDNLLNRIQTLEKKLQNGEFTVPAAIEKPSAISVKPAGADIIEPDKIHSSSQIGNIKPDMSDFKESSEKKPEEKNILSTSMETVKSENIDTEKLWVSILQSIDSPPNRAFYSNLARPVEISEDKIIIAFKKEMFVKQAKEGAKKQALVDAVSKYLNIKNPNIEIIISDNIDLSKKPAAVQQPVQNHTQEENITKQEEEEYHAFVEAKREENKSSNKPVDSSSQAAMVKDLFDGKYID